MTYFDVTHIAISVPNLREAERYYCELFDLEVAWRDTRGATSVFATWEEIEAAGVQPWITMLTKGAFRLAIEEAGSKTSSRGPGLDHLGLQADAEQLRRVAARAAALGLQITASRADELLSFRDRLGLAWELDTRSHADQLALGRELEERRKAPG